jgi:adenylosuccinate lyase
MSLLFLTHGQPATITNLGKELAIFISRVEREIALIKKIKL